MQDLGGAYALDAVDDEERAAIEGHLAECPTCRAELAENREVASRLSGASEPTPPELWDRIAHAIHEPGARVATTPAGATRATPPTSTLEAARRRRRTELTPRQRVRAGMAGIAAVAAALIAVLAVQVSHLNGQVNNLKAAEAARGLAPAVASALVSPHREVTLSSATRRGSTELVISRGEAFWVRSTLPRLSNGRTYQVWALVRGRPVSVALVSDPGRYSVFELGTSARTLMITNEPAGGTPAPTTPVIAQASLA
ncbi:MAG: anti-sigma factor domain-containing protein [Acidimicrobiales bacterium]